MPHTITLDEVFAEDSTNPPLQRSLPWIESANGITVVIEQKPHWAEELRAFRRDCKEYCRYADWLADGGLARFFGHIDTCGEEVLAKARTMIACEIADGLWGAVG